MPYNIISTLHGLTQFLHQPNDVGTIIIPILKRGQLSLKEAKQLSRVTDIELLGFQGRGLTPGSHR